MPNDIVGTQILNSSTGEMTTQLGPVHANIVLLDEINRSSAKTQSAMLEAMQERQTSIGGVVYPLPHPFMVLATQNPIEEEGTYVLPEAQMDRFLMKEVLTYPRPSEEADVLDRISNGTFDQPSPSPLATSSGCSGPPSGSTSTPSSSSTSSPSSTPPAAGARGLCPAWTVRCGWGPPLVAASRS